MHMWMVVFLKPRVSDSGKLKLVDVGKRFISFVRCFPVVPVSLWALREPDLRMGAATKSAKKLVELVLNMSASDECVVDNCSIHKPNNTDVASFLETLEFNYDVGRLEEEEHCGLAWSHLQELLPYSCAHPNADCTKVMCPFFHPSCWVDDKNRMAEFPMSKLLRDFMQFSFQKCKLPEKPLDKIEDGKERASRKTDLCKRFKVMISDVIKLIVELLLDETIIVRASLGAALGLGVSNETGLKQRIQFLFLQTLVHSLETFGLNEGEHAIRCPRLELAAEDPPDPNHFLIQSFKRALSGESEVDESSLSADDTSIGNALLQRAQDSQPFAQFQNVILNPPRLHADLSEEILRCERDQKLALKSYGFPDKAVEYFKHDLLEVSSDSDIKEHAPKLLKLLAADDEQESSGEHSGGVSLAEASTGVTPPEKITADTSTEQVEWRLRAVRKVLQNQSLVLAKYSSIY